MKRFYSWKLDISKRDFSQKFENGGTYVHRSIMDVGERGGSVVECRTPEREVRGSKPTAAVLCP